jgi:hypothetical protein
VDLVVRNVTAGSSRDITFEFSTPIDDSDGFVISDLRYYKDGVDFLGPDEHIACVWGPIEPLAASLRKKGLHEGITVRVSKDLGEESYQTERRITPLLYEGNRPVPRQDLEVLLLALEKIPRNTSGGASETARGVTKDDGSSA